MKSIPVNLQKCAEIVQNCSALLIGAGAGMGVDSGLPDFRGKEGFWQAYPPLAKLGLRFEEMADPRWFREDPQLAWGFYGHRYNLYQATKPHKGYFILLNWVKNLKVSSFVFTSNVDGHFSKTGWTEKVLECHGSLMRLQCLNSCGQPIWYLTDSSTKAFDICPDSLICKSPLPVCPKCSSLARPNILMFSDFHWDTSCYSIQDNKLQKWLKKYGGNKLLIMEFGAGLTVPTVRFFCERTWRKYACNMIRINPQDSMVPDGAHSIAGGALKTLKLINESGLVI